MDPVVIVTAAGWISMVALNVIILVLSRRDRVAERLGALDQRLARIEGILTSTST